MPQESSAIGRHDEHIASLGPKSFGDAEAFPQSWTMPVNVVGFLPRDEREHGQIQCFQFAEKLRVGFVEVAVTLLSRTVASGIHRFA
jgi:hypothetical protein